VKKAISLAMIVLGVGMVMFGFSDYVPGSAGDAGGWSESCRMVMTAGAMLAAGGFRI